MTLRLHECEPSNDGTDRHTLHVDSQIPKTRPKEFSHARRHPRPGHHRRYDCGIDRPCGLDDDQLILVRLAALAAVDARPVSYLAHIGPSLEAGVTLEQVQDVLVAVAPIIGTARVMAAAEHIAEALGFAIAVAGSCC